MATLLNAQEGWTIISHDEDPMKGQSAFNEYVYTNENGFSFSWSENAPDHFKLISSTNVFNIHDDTTIGFVGFYDESGKYIEKWPLMMVANSNFARLTTNEKILNSIKTNREPIDMAIAHWRECKGSIRFLFTLYGGEEFDLEVPCL